MNLLETFMILFDSDAKKVKDGADDAGKSSKKLSEWLKHVNDGSEKAGESFKDLAKEALGAIAATIGVFEAVRGVFESEKTAEELGRTADAIGENVSTLDMWGNAAKAAGGSAEGLQGSVKNLIGSMAQMDALGRSRVAPFFQELGIKMTDAHGKAKPVFGLLTEMSGKFEHMNKEQSLGFGRKMGLDDGTIMLLQRGKKGLEELLEKQKELGVITKQDADTAKKFYEEWDDVTHAFRTLGLEFGTMILPALTDFLEIVEHVSTWVASHGTLVTGFFGALGGLLITIYVPAMLKAAWATIVATWPFIAMAAAVLAAAAVFALLYEDIEAYMNGAPSLIGKGIAKINALFSGLGSTVRKIWQEIKDSILHAIQAIIDGVQKAKDYLGFGKGASSTLDAARSHLQTTSSAGAAALTSGTIMNSSRQRSTNVSVGEINVQTQATDANGIANGIGDAMHRHIRQTIANSDDGIAG